MFKVVTGTELNRNFLQEMTDLVADGYGGCDVAVFEDGTWVFADEVDEFNSGEADSRNYLIIKLPRPQGH